MTAVEQKKGTRRAGCIGLSVLILVVLTVGVVTGLVDDVDAAILGAVHGSASPGLTQIALLLSEIGSFEAIYMMAVVVAAALLLLGQRAIAARFVAVMAVAFVLNSLVKIAVARPRPEPFFGTAPETYSFASGHALFSGCFFGFVGLFVASGLKEAWQRVAARIATAALIGAIGLARVYQGVHFPSDVIAGFALAAIILCAVDSMSEDV